MLNRIFKISTFIAVVLVFTMTSCQKDNLDELITENFTDQTEESQFNATSRTGNNIQNKRNGKRGKCFKAVYPLTLNFPDGTSTVVADRTAAKAAAQVWKAANPDATERPSIAFPYEVQLQDSTLATIASQEELVALKATCDSGKGRGDRCFTKVYPLTINFPDGSSEEVADRAAAKAAAQAWKAANPEATERPSIAFPYEVQLQDSTLATIASQEELDALKATCDVGNDRGAREGRRTRGNRGGRGERCFTKVYPLSLNFPDGSSEEVADRAAAKAAAQAWKAANPDATEKPSIAFPFDVELADGTIVTLGSEEEVAGLKEDCQEEGN